MNQKFSLSNIIKTGFNLYLSNPLLLIAAGATVFAVSTLPALLFSLFPAQQFGMLTIIVPLIMLLGLLLSAGQLLISFDVYDTQKSSFGRLFAGHYLIMRFVGALFLFILPATIGLILFVIGFLSLLFQFIAQTNPALLAVLDASLPKGLVNFSAYFSPIVTFAMCIVSLPLLWLCLRWSFTFHVLANKNYSIGKSLKTSYEITCGYLWYILAIMLLQLPFTLSLRYSLGHLGNAIYALSIWPIAFMIYIALYRALLKKHEERNQLS